MEKNKVTKIFSCRFSELIRRNINGNDDVEYSYMENMEKMQ